MECGPHALVIGGGVSGLTTAKVLLDKGYQVTVIAHEYTSTKKRITSQIAGALWEWPPAVCGSHGMDPQILERSQRWCMTSFHEFQAMHEKGTPGVRMCMANFFFPTEIDNDQLEKTKREGMEAHPELLYRNSLDIVKELPINEDYGIKAAYQYKAPVIDTDRYMCWLTQDVGSNKNARMFQLHKPFTKELKEMEKYLLSLYKADFIVNCTGLGSKQLAKDANVYPLRGALLRRVADVLDDDTITGNEKDGKLPQAICITLAGRQKEADMVFIIPRNDNIVVVGGIAERDETSLEINEENHEPLKMMWERNVKFYPNLRKTLPDNLFPIAVGLRPARDGGVRLEHEAGTRIIHNYGHAGSGFSFSFGCANDVAELADKMTKKDPCKKSLKLSKSLGHITIDISLKNK